MKKMKNEGRAIYCPVFSCPLLTAHFFQPLIAGQHGCLQGFIGQFQEHARVEWLAQIIASAHMIVTADYIGNLSAAQIHHRHRFQALALLDSLAKF